MKIKKNKNYKKGYSMKFYINNEEGYLVQS